MVRQLVDIHQRGGTQISMAILATTATRIAIMPTILATTPTILSIPPSRATGTITALAGRGEVTTRSQLVERCAVKTNQSHLATDIDRHTLSDGDGGCHVKIRASARGGFNGVT